MNTAVAQAKHRSRWPERRGLAIEAGAARYRAAVHSPKALRHRIEPPGRGSSTPTGMIDSSSTSSPTGALCVAGPLETVGLHQARRGVRAYSFAEDLSAGDLHSLAVTMREVTRRTDAGSSINERADIAPASARTEFTAPADSLVGPGPEVLRIARRSASRTPLNGRSRPGRPADSVLFGPVLPTPSKAKYGAPQGLSALSVVARGVGVPVFAIAGSPRRTAPLASREGAAGDGVISAILLGQGLPRSGGVLPEKPRKLSSHRSLALTR